MKKLSLFSVATIIALVGGVSATHAAESPLGYTPLTWVGEEGITSYMKAPTSVGYIDYLTVIDLSKNDIQLFSSSTPKVYEGPAISPFTDALSKNWLFARTIVESLKSAHTEAAFIWNAPFFNVEMSTTVLSMALKSTDSEGPYITTGGRPAPDMAQDRKMLIVDNKTKTARVADFDETSFVNEGDQAVEGFHPLGLPSEQLVQAARLYLGVRNAGKELVVYCSKSASRQEASAALEAAGVPVTDQIQLDGGGSATCGYNLPGMYFVEPNRALSHIMAAVPSFAEGTVTINNLNVRSGIGTSHSVTRRLALNETVTLYEKKDGWVRISDTEWISGQFVKEIKTLPYTATVTIQNLNVRSGIGTGFGVTRKLNLDDEVTVLEEKDGWVQISDSEWISESFIE